MKIINSSYEILEQKSGLEGIYEQVELAGRTCYKSKRPKGTTAKDFVDRMIKSGHGAALEHGTVYLKVPNSTVDRGFQFGTNWSILCHNPYTRYIKRYTNDGDYYYYTTNYRVIENDLQGVLKYICEPTEHHEKRVTVKFICDRALLSEFTRHRVFSFCAESTRYCDYAKDKFNSELTFIQPSWFKHDMTKKSFISNISIVRNTPLEGYEPGEDIWLESMLQSEYYYKCLRNSGWKPEQARAVLPNSLKTELIMTGFISDWDHFFSLRARGTTGVPHPDASSLASPLYKEFISRGYMEPLV